MKQTELPTAKEFLIQNNYHCSEDYEPLLIKFAKIHTEVLEKELYTENDIKMTIKLSREGYSSIYSEEEIIEKLNKRR